MADANQKRTRRPQRADGFSRFRSALLADPGLSLVKQERDGWRYGLPFAVLQQGATSLTLLPPDDGLVTLSYAGPVDLSFLMMGQAYSEGSGRFAASAVVVDFRHADIGFSGADLDTALSFLLSEHQRRPRALLTQPKHARMFHDFAVRSAAALGAFQRGFVEWAHAEAWARQTAAGGRG